MAVGDQQVRDAVEFSQEMRNHQRESKYRFLSCGLENQCNSRSSSKKSLKTMSRAEERMRSSQAISKGPERSAFQYRSFSQGLPAAPLFAP